MRRDGKSPGRMMAVGRTLRTGAALTALLVAVGGCKPLDDAMVAIFGRSMRNSVSFDPYENPRPPDSTSVSFSSGNFPAAEGEVNVGQPEGLATDVPPLTPSDMNPPGSDVVNGLVNPVAADSAALARGQVMYERMCSPCHGVAGVSDESPMVQEIPGMQLMLSFNLATGNAVGYSDGYIFGMISVGRGLMPSYGHRVTYVDRWHIVNYVRELQRRAARAGGGGAADTAGAGGAAVPDTAAAPDPEGAPEGALEGAPGEGG